MQPHPKNSVLWISLGLIRSRKYFINPLNIIKKDAIQLQPRLKSAVRIFPNNNNKSYQKRILIS